MTNFLQEIPVLTTPRLTMRGHLAADLDATAALWSDPEVVRQISGMPSNREEALARLLRYAGLWSLLDFGYWLVEARATGSFVGEVGFANFHREVVPTLGDALEAGWVVAPGEQDKGYATEAVQAALGWANLRHPGRRSVCMIAPANAPSLRVARKCGYAEYARTTYKGEATLLFERG